jgi:hypothetical protein
VSEVPEDQLAAHRLLLRNATTTVRSLEVGLAQFYAAMTLIRWNIQIMEDSIRERGAE